MNIRQRIAEVVKNSAWSIQRPFHASDAWPITVLSGPARGARLTLDVRIEGAYWFGTYDTWILDRFRIEDWLPVGGVGWDCGSYVGYYGAIMRKAVGTTGIVHCFEASSKNYERLSELPKINNWGNVKISKLAVGPDHTTISFAGELNGSSGPVGFAKNYADVPNVERVISAGLDELHQEYGVPLPDLVKLDLETGEEYALHNGPVVFRDKRPVLLLEWHGERMVPAVGKFLSSYEYCAWDVLNFNLPDGRVIRSEVEFAENHQNMSNTLICLPEERSTERCG